MNIVFLAPLYSEDIKELLAQPPTMPTGYYGAPFIANIIRTLLLKGHNIITITTDANVDSTQFYSSTCKKFQYYIVPARKHSFRFNGFLPGRALDFFAHERRQMSKIIHDCKPDIIHAHWSYEFASVAIDSGLPYLITVHDNHWKVFRYMMNIYRFFRAVMAEKNLLRIKVVTTVSPYMATFLTKRKKIVHIIPNPVEVSYDRLEISIATQNRLKTLKSPQIIMVNNGWEGLKNGSFGLKVFQSLLKQIPTCKLHLVGEGSEKNGPASREAEKLGVNNNIEYHGKLSNKSLLTLLSSIHILLHTSKEESFGVVLCEAASRGVPAFGFYKAGAVPWVINDEDLLFKNWNHEDVSNQLINLLKYSETYRLKSLKVYENVVRYFSVENVVAGYEEQYKKTLECLN